MGWIAYTREGEFLEEGHDYGRPVDAGNNNELVLIGQIDYGHSVAVSLDTGEVALDWTNIGYQNGTFELENPKYVFCICDETNIVGELKHLKQEFVPWRGESNDDPIRYHEDGSMITVRNDILSPLIWRPIWFSRNTNGDVTKVIGAQTTLPEDYGGRNVKKLISLFSTGRVGID